MDYLVREAFLDLDCCCECSQSNVLCNLFVDQEIPILYNLSVRSKRMMSLIFGDADSFW
jgi:hypothetical protein